MTKYIIESLGAVVGLIFLSFIWFVFDARSPTDLPSDFLCDNIVVLTGGKNRIKLALDSIHRFKAKNVFISGVYEKTKLQDILMDSDIGDVTVSLGYKAKNTRENAKEVREMAEDLDIHEIVLITSDYHMKRSLYEIKRFNPGLKVYPMKVRSTLNFGFLFLCLKEFCRLPMMYFRD